MGNLNRNIAMSLLLEDDLRCGDSEFDPSVKEARPEVGTWLASPCLQPELPPAERDALNDFCGYKKGFTHHDWCKRHYLGLRLEDGTVRPCDCACHQPA